MTVTRENAKKNLFSILDGYPDKADALLAAVRSGKIDGRKEVSQENPECGCIFGHLSGLSTRLALDIARPWRASSANDGGDGMFAAIELFVLGENYMLPVLPGDVPATEDRLADLESWINEWKGVK